MAVLTPQEAASRLQQLAAQVGDVIRRTLADGLAGARPALQRGFASRGLGRALWGAGLEAGGADVPALMVSDRPTSTGAVLEVHGMGSLIETGGRTQQHPIAPRIAEAMAGGLLHPVKDELLHPGSRVDANPQLPGLARELEAQLPLVADAELQARIDALGLS
jgi:hypothetical protein